ncbi:MAG: hypothetical protein PF574_09030 [Candidatus Delongbacteria bacterium]|jgi:hypothetical protein|nr:hypothetical protein [Candidatus Delongbacteria bacterium]
MYKFNFLQKINLEKRETSKKNKFITTVFMMSITAQLILLGLLFLKSLSVNSSFQEAVIKKNDYEKQTKEFRNKDFFGYKKINHVYNALISKRQLTFIFKSFETSLDTTMIVNRFSYDEPKIRLDIISRTKGSKSKLMSDINKLRSTISEKLLADNYIQKSSNIELIKGPDLDDKGENDDGTQYWSFSYSIDMKRPKVNVKKKKKKKNQKVNI